MKICWDNLEGLRYNKKTGKFYYKKHWYVEKICKSCGEVFLSNKNKTIFCDVKCSNTGINNPNYSKKLSRQTKKKISEGNCGKGNNGYRSKNIPIYDTYASQLEWCEEVRRSLKDKNVLEVKCTYCGRWFVPDLRHVHNRVRSINGVRKSVDRFYCSDNCKLACPIYRKKAETLMREDAIRAGRLEWLELNREVQPELRQMVLERDGYKCVKCGSKGPLHCHHILPVAEEPLLSADIDNCITLCEDCHKVVHKLPGCGYGEIRQCN